MDIANKLVRNIKRRRRFYLRQYCDFLPASEAIVIKSKNKTTKVNLKKDDIIENNNKYISKEFRVNEVNIQMVSKNIYEQLFKKPPKNVDPNIIQRCQEDLLKHGINYKDYSVLPDVELKLPKLEGNDIEEHFYNIGEKQSAPYRKLLNKLATSKLPPLPKKWSRTKGWCKYTNSGPPEPVPYPPDDALIFDVEVLMSAGKRPTLACAVSSEAWYGWVSTRVANGDPQEYFDNVNYEDLIPLETDESELNINDLSEPRIVIGHNVSYDRAKVKEQYWLEKTGVRFMDTMSMHTCVSGVTSYQRAVLKAKNKEPDPSDDSWIDISSLNSLTEVHNLYCGTPVDKQTRDVFVDGTMEDVHENFQALMEYCARDVIATHNVLSKLLPMFLERFPHPVTLAGMLELGTAYLPVNSNWQQYIDSSDTIFEDLKLESRQLLSLKADEACKMMNNDEYKKDIWMWDQDWSIQNLKLKKQISKKKYIQVPNIINNVPKDIETLEHPNVTEITKMDSIQNTFKDILCEDYLKIIEYKKFNSIQPVIKSKMDDLTKKFAYLYDMGKMLPVKRPYLAGYPAWYRKLCTKPGKDPDWIPGANNITTSMQITPKLLRLTWEGYPLHHIQGEGWGFLVPYSRLQEDVEGQPRLPLEKLLEACPLAQMPKEVDTELYVLPKTVEEDLSRKAYYARKKFEDKAAANQYHGLGVWSGIQLQGCCHFLRLPHKDGPKYKVGNPLAKDFLNMFSQNVLAARGNEAEKVLTFALMMSYWRNNRERIRAQQVVWLPVRRRPQRVRNQRQYGAIIPQVVVCGTLTRRCVSRRSQNPPQFSKLAIERILEGQTLHNPVFSPGWVSFEDLPDTKKSASEPTWMTASNAHAERIGSELRAMVQAPPGYNFVGADVDSQELWIAALLGDSSGGVCGGTAFGWAVLAGDKARRTDLHSLTAAAAGVNRDHAKVINYARIYGAGQNFAERLLKQFNPTMTISEAKSKAAKMFTSTKGRRVYVLKKKYMEGLIDEDLEGKTVEMSGYQAMRLAKLSGKKVEDMFERPAWLGGTESQMFNKLEEIAASEAPSTAFLCGRLSRALARAGGRWAGTRLNWAVQSAAADFLHLMLVSMSHLAPHARFCLSFHDEVRYLVPEHLKYETALALHITNLLTRAFCSQRVGINDLPQSVAFFTSVEVDQVLRKECNHSCTTPSNPHGLERGYGIPNGESLSIFDAIEKCKKINK